MARSQYDKFPAGGSDGWDNDNAGAILTAEFFGATPVGGSLKQWNGSAWVAKPLNAWPASTFVRGVLKRWTGAEWRLAAT